MFAQIEKYIHTFVCNLVIMSPKTEEIARFLGIYHCDEVQGFHYARPMPAEAFVEWLRQRT